MKLIWKFLCLLFLLEELAVSWAEDAKCTITGADPRGQNDYYMRLPIKNSDPIYDNTFGKLLETPYTGVIDGMKCDADAPYEGFFDVATADSNLIISSIQDKMETFDKVTPHQETNYMLVIIKCTFKCGTLDSSLEIGVMVTDFNNNPPEFTESTYELVVPVPLPIDYVTSFKGVIVAEDIDFSNSGIDFTIDPEDFDIKSTRVDKTKQYTATFTTKKLIQFSDKQTFTITATDEGNVPGKLKSSVTLTLKVDPKNSADDPSFQDTSYEFNYKTAIAIDSKNKKDIILNTRKPEAVTVDSMKISGDLQPFLTPTFNKDTKMVSLEVKEITLKLKTLISTLTVTTDGVREAQTAIVVYMPDVWFKSSFYTATYHSNNNTVGIDDQISFETSNGEKAEVKLEGDNAQYFVISCDETNKCDLTPKDEAKSLVNIAFIQLEISASLGSATSAASLLVKIPSKSDKISFTKDVYDATYKIDPLSVTVDQIAFSSTVDEAIISVNSKYADYFKVDYTAGKVTLLTTGNVIAGDILQKQTSILLTLTATDEKKETTLASCKVNVKLPDATKAPIYDKTFYKLTYPKNAKSGDEIDLAISFTNVDPTKIVLEIEGYTDNFAVSYKDSKWVSMIKKPINSPILTNLVAKRKEGNVMENKAALYINIDADGDLAPKFTNLYYEADYVVTNGKHSITSVDIELSNVGKAEDIEITANDYTTNFEFKFDGTSKWKIELKDSLSDDVLRQKSQLVIELTAKEKGKSVHGSAFLVVTLPLSLAPVFSSSMYQAKYSLSGGKPSIEMTENVKIIAGGDHSIVTLSCKELDKIEDYLSIIKDTDHYKIEATSKQFPGDILRKNSISVDISAENNGIKRNAALVIAIPNIQFSNVLYNGQYNAKDSKLSFGAITITTAEADESIDCCEIESDFKKWFDGSYENKQIKVTLKTAIPKNRLRETSTITLKLSVGIKGSFEKSSTVLNFEVKGIESDSDNSDTNETIYIVVICALALLIAILVISAVVFYRRKLRKQSSYEELDEEKPKVKFEKGSQDSISSSRKNSITTRRPTGYVFEPPPDEEGDKDENLEPSAPKEEENEYTEPIENIEPTFAENRERRKSVVFDDNVEKVEIETNTDDDREGSIASFEKQSDIPDSDSKLGIIENNTTKV